MKNNTKDENMIDGLKVRLRGLELSDAELIYKNWNSLELRTYLASRMPNSVDEEREFIKMTWNARKSGDVTFGIETLAEKKLVGTIGFGRMWSLVSGSAEVGIAIWEPEERSKGYGTEAMNLLLFYAFELMDLHRLQLHVLGFNTRAIASYKKAGFKEVGRLREAEFIYNKHHDMVVMDILRTEIIYPVELEAKLQTYRNLAVIN
jgi:RimJ/RimL family protein N-acetyltransferase